MLTGNMIYLMPKREVQHRDRLIISLPVCDAANYHELTKLVSIGDAVTTLLDQGDTR